MKPLLSLRHLAATNPSTLGSGSWNDDFGIEQLCRTFKLLSDPSRLKILLTLRREGEMHVTALCRLLTQSQPAVSHHLMLLRMADLVRVRRAGRHNYYSLDDRQVAEVVTALTAEPVRPEVEIASICPGVAVNEDIVELLAQPV